MGETHISVGTMATSSQNTRLTRQARLLKYLGAPMISLGTTYVSQTTGLLSPLAYVPSVVALRFWRRANGTNPSRRGELSPMVSFILLYASLFASV